MSRIRFLCPECSAKLSVESDNANLFTDCPKCGKTIRAWGSPLLDIKFSCSSCGKKMVIDSGAAGCTVTCPSCDKPTRVPEDTRKPEPGDAVKPQPVASSPRSPMPAPQPLLSSEEVTFLVGDAH